MRRNIDELRCNQCSLYHYNTVILKILALYSPLWEEGINYPITEWVDGQLWNSLEVFPAKWGEYETEEKQKYKCFPPITFQTFLFVLVLDIIKELVMLIFLLK